MTTPFKSATVDGPALSSKPRLRFIILGIVLILCGIFAVLAPFLSTLATTMIVAIAAAVAGVAQVLQAFRAPAWRGLFLNLLLGLLYLAGSAAFLFSPVTGALAIAVTLAWLLLITGVGEIILGFRIRPQRGWQWLIVSGLIAIIAGAWLIFRLPIAGFFVPGVMLGIALMSEGVAFVAVGFGGKERATTSPQPVAPRPDRGDREAREPGAA